MTIFSYLRLCNALRHSLAFSIVSNTASKLSLTCTLKDFFILHSYKTQSSLIFAYKQCVISNRLLQFLVPTCARRLYREINTLYVQRTQVVTQSFDVLINSYHALNFFVQGKLCLKYPLALG